MAEWFKNGKFDLFISVILILYLCVVQAVKNVLRCNKLTLFTQKKHLNQILVLMKLHPSVIVSNQNLKQLHIVIEMDFCCLLSGKH